MYEDIVNWWPKLRKGGIIAGHDYVTQDEVGRDQDWTVNYDGTKDETRTVVKTCCRLISSESVQASNRCLQGTYVEHMGYA